MQTNNLNILEFCLSPDLGGLEMFMVNCYKEFKKNTQCKVIIEKNTKLDNFLESENPFYIKRNKFFPIIPAIKLAKYIATIILAKVLSTKKPKIIQTRNMTMTRFKDDFYHKWLYKNIDTMHAVTYQVKEQLHKFIPENVCPNVEMVYMGTEEKKIDKDKIEELQIKYDLADSKTFIVGIVGRIEEGKGQYLVIEAIEKLKDLNIKAMIVGHTMDGDYLNSLKDKIKNMDIEDKVIFTGFTKEVDAHMQLFDANILATPKETFGLVVIEAMMNKVCMIATNNGGPLEIIDDEKDGLLFDRTSNDLAKKIKKLYLNEEMKINISQSGYLKAKEKFDNKIQINKLYNTLVEINK